MLSLRWQLLRPKLNFFARPHHTKNHNAIPGPSQHGTLQIESLRTAGPNLRHTNR
jgi:hypothetical protein